MKQLQSEIRQKTCLAEQYQLQPLDYLQQMTMDLAKIQSSDEMEKQLDKFLTPDTLSFLELNPEVLLVLGYVWSATIRRVVFNEQEIIFPNLLLLFPPIYHELNWTDEDNTEWNEVHQETLNRFETAPRMDEAVMLLFLEGMKFSLYDAMIMFHTRRSLLKTKRERINAENLQWELQQYGWPEVQLRYLA